MSLHRRLIPLAVLLLAGLHSGHGFAAERPLWELGTGIGVLSLPDYRGSDQSSLYAIPFPYLVYRGEFLKADRHGIRDTLFGSDRIELNFSLGALQPVNSDDNRACQGMSDLQPVAELGPSLNLNLWRTPDLRTRLDLRLPIRSAVAVKGGMNEIGWVFSPRLNRDIADVAGLPGWKRAATPAASS